MNPRKHSRLRNLQGRRKCQRVMNRLAAYMLEKVRPQWEEAYRSNLLYGTPVDLEAIVRAAREVNERE